MLLSKSELKLQKKGIQNFSIEELKQWIDICKRNELDVKYKKARKSWIESRSKAEYRLIKISKLDCND